MSSRGVHETYARLLKWYEHGHALFFPVNSNEIKPGCVGYFDDGHWITLLRTFKDAPIQQPWEHLGLSETDTNYTPEPTRDVAVFTSESVYEIAHNLGLVLE